MRISSTYAPRMSTWRRLVPSVSKPRDSYSRRALSFVPKTASSAFLKPPAFFIEVRRNLIEQDVDLLSPDEVHVPQEGLRVAEARWADDHPPPILERDFLGPHRVGHGRHSGNLSSTSGRRRSPLARNASICSFSWGVSSA